MIKSSANDFYVLHENMAVFLADHSSDVMGKASVIMHYNFRIIHDALSEFISERDKIIEKYASVDEEGNPMQGIAAEDTENLEKAMAEIKELGDIEMELPILTLPIEDLYKVAEIVPAANIGALIWMTNEYQDTLKTDKDKDSK